MTGPLFWNGLQSSSPWLVCHSKAVRSAPWSLVLLLPTCAGTKACRDSWSLHGDNRDGLLFLQALSEDLEIVWSGAMIPLHLEDKQTEGEHRFISVSWQITHTACDDSYLWAETQKKNKWQTCLSKVFTGYKENLHAGTMSCCFKSDVWLKQTCRVINITTFIMR